MLNLMDGTTTPDDEIEFCDGILYIISQDPMKCERYLLDPEYDASWTLEEIGKRYPKATKVIFEDMLKGYVYNYKNHYREYSNDEKWELVGTTLGYA